jgi:hypothetical protein
MIRRKSKAIISVRDGIGGMSQVIDHRFRTGSWPIQFDVQMPGADSWMQYFSSACLKKGWATSGIGQPGPKENSGCQTISKGPGQPQLAIAWDRRRGGRLLVKAASVGTPDFDLAEARAFLDEVTDRCLDQVKERHYGRGQLTYDSGRPWLGELWLDDETRLSKPSQDGPTNAHYLPRVIVVDTEVLAIDGFDAGQALRLKLRELAVFMSVVLGQDVKVPDHGWAWTTARSESGDVLSEVRELGYVEMERSDGMPQRGQVEAIRLRDVKRPDFSLLSNVLDFEYMGERPPSDIIELWQSFASLSPEHRRQFLSVAGSWRVAISLHGDDETVGYALMTAACEALKPRDPEFRDCNFYDVAEALFGPAFVAQLKSFRFPPVDVRNALLHSGEFKGTEFIHEYMMSSFTDPTFHLSSMDLRRVTQAMIIEWLMRGGQLAMPAPQKQPWLRRRYRGRDVVRALLAVSTLGFLAGLAAGVLALG